MVISDKKQRLVQAYIQRVYSKSFAEQQIQSLAHDIVSITGSDYFGMLLYPNGALGENKYISTSKKSYTKLYSSLIPKDFLLQNLIEKNEITLLSSFQPDQIITNGNREFCIETIRSRPITDVCYFPLRVNGYLAGHAAVAKAGVNRMHMRSLKIPAVDVVNEPFSKNDMQFIGFLLGFFNEGLSRSLAAPPGDENTGYIDGYCRIVQAGQRIRDIFTGMFGHSHWEDPSGSNTQIGFQFADRVRNFLFGPLIPGSGELTLPFNGEDVRFSMSRLHPEELRPYFPREPQLKIVLQVKSDQTVSENISKKMQLLYDRYGLTPREIDAARGIFRGMSNGEISKSLTISEATVKRHVYNLFQKVGVESRIQLLFKMNLNGHVREIHSGPN